MGAWASALQGVGSAGNDVSQGRQIRDQWNQQQVMDKLNAFTAQARLQQLQQQLKNTPENQLAAVEQALGRKLTDPEKQALLGIQPAQPKPLAETKTTWKVEVGSDGKPHNVLYNDTTGEKIKESSGINYEKPEPAKEPKEPKTETRVETVNGVPRDVIYDDKGNVISVSKYAHYEKPEKDSGGVKSPTPAQLASQFNQTLNTFKTQLSQANTALNQAVSQKTQHPFYSRLGLIGSDIEPARAARDRAAKAISYLLSQKQAVLSGKADPQEVSNRAQSIMDGSDSGQTAPGGTAGETNPGITIERDANGRIVGVK